MSTLVFKTGESYPNLKGTISWAGSLITSTITGSLIANGLTTGPFTGAVTVTSFDSENPSASTWSWSYDVQPEDTVEGTYEICINITHDSGETEKVVPTNPDITVETC